MEAITPLLANTTDAPEFDACFYEPPPMTNERFWLVTVFGSAVSFISIVNNMLLFYLFASKRHHRSNHNMYLMLLAFFDFFVSVAYICLMSVNVLSDYLQEPFLVKIWFLYMVPMITISHIAMTSSSFLIVAATFERYCLTLNTTTLPFVQRRRKLIAAGSIFLGVISKGSMCLEFELFEMSECAGLMTETQMGYRAFVFETPYHVVWRFWYRNFVTIFAPFIILSYLNFRIVKALTDQSQLTVCHIAGNNVAEQAKRKMSLMPHMDPIQRKATARAATRTLVMVVCCYLISNIINVILTIWEHLDKTSLVTTYIDCYAIAVDLVSLLTTIACAFRLPIYMVCQSTLRGEIKEILMSICSSEMRNYQTSRDCVIGSSVQRTSTRTSRITTDSSTDTKETVVDTPHITDDEERKLHLPNSSFSDHLKMLSFPSSPEENLLRSNNPYETLL